MEPSNGNMGVNFVGKASFGEHMLFPPSPIRNVWSTSEEFNNLFFDTLGV